MPETRTYTGGCHCGNVRYAVTMELGEVLKCNCSICSKTGSLLAAVSPPLFELLAGSDRLSDYQFAGRTSTTCSARIAGSARSHGARGRAATRWSS
jgi:hypothetical protein